MRIVVCGSAKGGVGKSTVLMLLAMYWRHRFSVVVIDLNRLPQSFEWADNINIASVHYPEVTTAGFHQFLKNLKFEIALVDLPPESSVAVGAAIALSDVVLLPFFPSRWEFRGAEMLIKVIELTVKLRRRPPIVIGVPCRMSPRQREAKFETMTLPFDLKCAPPLSQRVQIQRSASLSSDLFVPYPVTKAEREMHDLSNYVLDELLNSYTDKIS